MAPLQPLRQLHSKLLQVRNSHAVRRRPTGFRFATAEDIRFLNPKDWDVVTAEASFFLSRAYLEVLSDHAPDNLSPRCALIYDGDHPVAAVAAQVVELAGERMVKAAPSKVSSTKAAAQKPLLKRTLGPLARNTAAKLKERVLVCGNLLSWGQHGVGFAVGADPATLWPAVTEALYRIRRGEKLMGDTALLLIKDFHEGQMANAERLRTYSYRPLETDPNMVLEFRPEWQNYDHYLASLDAKYRKSVRQLAVSCEDAGVYFEPLESLAPHQERLHDLYLQVRQAAAVQPITLKPSYLPALAEAAGKGFRCTVARRGDEIVGFVTSVKDGDTAIGYYIGYERALAAEGVPIYLRLLHSTVDHAMQLGCQRLSLGRTALEPKARLGAKPVRLHLWTRHRVPALNWLLRSVLQAVPHEEAPERNPFRKGV